MNSLLKDLKYGFRMMVKNPGFSAIAVATLALGIGATTAMFSVVNAIILRPLPYPHPEEVVGLGQNRVQKGMGYVQTGVSVPNIRDIAARNHVFQEVGYYRWHPFNLTKTQPPQRLEGARISTGLLPVFGVQPLMGRFFSADETQPGRGHVAVITYELWRNRLGGNPDILGKSLSLDDETYSVVGVLPANFHFAWDSPMDVFVPLVLTPQEIAESARTTRDLQTIARMKLGVTPPKAQAEMNELALRLAQEYPDANRGWGIKVEPLHDAYHRRMDTALWAMLAAVGLVLLIACVNVANLSLARLSARRKEFAVRLAVGASRVRLVRQLLAECLLFSILGGGLGILLAAGALKLISWACSLYNLQYIPGMRDLSLDWRVVAFSVAISLATGIIVGVAPAFKASKSDVQDALKESAQNVTGAAGHKRLLNSLVIIEMSLAMVLLVGSGLLLKSFVKLVNVDLGFNPHHDVGFFLDLPEYKYAQPDQQITYFRQVLAQVSAVPGVVKAGGSAMNGEFLFNPAGQPRPAPGQEPAAYEYCITPGYFPTTGATLISGRDFSEQDDAKSLPVAIVNDTLAERYWKNVNPVGQHLDILSNVYDKQNAHTESYEVVGVVKNIKRYNVWEDIPEIFVPYEQHPLSYLQIEARTGPEPMTLAAPLKNAVHSIDSDEPIEEFETRETTVNREFGEIRFPMILVWSFSSLALLLSAIGLYGVMSYSVSRRTHELAIRMAMGAERRSLLKLVVLEGFSVTLIGIVVGTVTALVAGRVIASYLYGVRPGDPLTLVSVGVVLIGVALLACLLPAVRAMKINPMIALRYE